MKVLFIEPPKDFWFLMGEYLPPPLGLLQLAAYLEEKDKRVEIEVLDCQAEYLDWKGMERRIESFDPDIVASAGLSTCNTYTAVQTLGIAKKVDPSVLTVVGGQHFTVTAQESLEKYAEVDVIVRGEGEQTLVELVQALSERRPFSKVNGISFRHGEEILHNASRPLIEDLNSLPFPAYHLVEDVIHKYHFTMMAGPKTQYALIEGSRGCPHRCTFCTQWRHWEGRFRSKSAKRIADEMEFCHQKFGSTFLWLTDDNFGLGRRARDLCDEIIQRRLSDDLMWFIQARCDDVVEHQDILPKMRKAGNLWMLLGVESPSRGTLKSFNKHVDPEDAGRAVKLLKKNDIFAQTMFIIGEWKDSAESMAHLREYVDDLDPDLAIYMVLTPFPGTEIFETAQRNSWIEDDNWSNYDMAHAIMPTETLSREEVQEEFYRCYRGFYGSWGRRLKGVLSTNKLKRRTYRYLASRGLLNQLQSLF
ncbi:MAG: radical SAM protein [Nitrososphaeria archaeon]|nr:radical SAM protein [Nitrososphaeria archaeon]NIN53069.1 radical SAM protein [Nitrososphaeria archaeon]NIQ33653.1 radical SAM protein [Nitrososphaeria archaeon]